MADNNEKTQPTKPEPKTKAPIVPPPSPKVVDPSDVMVAMNSKKRK